MANDLDDIPPPPYTETDIFSNSGGSPSPILPSSHRRSSYPRGNASQSSPSTVDGDIIYTPPLTPHSSHQSQASNLNFAHNSSINDIDHLTTASAAAYFDTRPAPPTHLIQSRPRLIHAISVREDTPPDALPYPAELLAAEPERDITPQDWQTFVNYLIPRYHATSNEELIDRKLRAEAEAESASAWGISPVNTNNNNDNLNSPTSSLPHAEAQLNQIRVPTAAAAEPSSPLPSDGAASRRQMLEQTVREWNDGFFAPRGVMINVDGSEFPRSAMPGAWDTSFDQPQAQSGEAGPSTTQAGPSNNNRASAAHSHFARFMPQFRTGIGGGPSCGGGPGGGGGRGSNSFQFCGVGIDGDTGRVSFGDRVVADQNGLRVGGVVMDKNGITINGEPMFGGYGAAVGANRGISGGGIPGFGLGNNNGVNNMPGFGPGSGGGGGFPRFSGWGWGGGRGGRGRGARSGCDRGARGRGGGWGSCDGGGDGQRSRLAGQDERGDEEVERGPGGRHSRGRGRRQDGPHHRSRSHSASSVSSSSSSSSESSIGSLPDHDELQDSQLPVAKALLLAWLHDPEQQITKEKLREVKQKIKEAKQTGRNQPSGINEPANIVSDQKAMRKEVKALMKDWKNLKKQQAKLRRQLRRERKLQRRAEKRERRDTRREMRRAAREQRRAGRCNRGPCGPSVVPPISPVPGVPNAGPSSGPHGPIFGSGGIFGNGTNSPFGPADIFGNGTNSPFGLGGRPFQTTPPPQSEGRATATVDRINNDDRKTPGAWPITNDEDFGHDLAEAVFHRASQEKYKEAGELETQLVVKETELFELHEAIALNADDGGRDEPSITEQKQMLAARALEEEIQELEQKMALLTTEADAQYAMELAQMGDSCS